MSRCKVCFRHCEIHEGELGFCGARMCVDGAVIDANYGLLTALALDPIEKKPLRRFHPGSMILSVGSYGCNLRCPFCQNNSISWSKEAMDLAEACREPAIALAKAAGHVGEYPNSTTESTSAATADRNTTDSTSTAAADRNTTDSTSTAAADRDTTDSTSTAAADRDATGSTNAAAANRDTTDSTSTAAADRDTMESTCAATANRDTADSANSAIRCPHLPPGVRYTSPEDLARIAASCRDMGNIGVAFTYNEPLVGYEYVRDAARLVHEQGMKNVLVTNGTATPEILEELLPWIDAMNIDLKSFDGQWYRNVAGGSLSQVRDFIELAVKHCHVELTTLIIPGENDTDAQMLEQTEWISRLTDAAGSPIGHSIPLHITRFFPQFHMTDRPATDVSTIRHLATLAAQRLEHVYTGNC